MESETANETIDDNSRWMFPVIRATLKDCGVDEMPGCDVACARCKELLTKIDVLEGKQELALYNLTERALDTTPEGRRYLAYNKAQLADAERARDLEREAKDTLQTSCNAAFARIAELETQLQWVRAWAKAWKRAAKWERRQISDYEAAMYYAMFHEEDMRVERDALQARIDAMLAKVEEARPLIDEYLDDRGDVLYVWGKLDAIRNAGVKP